MTYQPYGSEPPRAPVRADTRPQVNAGRLWAGGVATALVAAATNLVGFIVVRGLLDIPVRIPGRDGSVVDTSAVRLAVIAALVTLLATGLLHLLLLTTPSPLSFFGWIVTLATAVAALWPFLTRMDLDSEIGGAAIAVVTGIAIGALLTSVARSSVRVGR